MADVAFLVVAAYVGVGVVFAAFFVTAGVSRVDAQAVGASRGFRVLILPGTIALWPLLWVKMRGAPRANEEAGES